MKIIKKIGWLVLCLAMIGTTVLTNDVGVKANTLLATNDEIITSINNQTDTYTFKMPKSGYCHCEVTLLYFTKDGIEVEPDFSYLKAKITVNHKEYEKEVVRKKDGTWKSKNYNFKPGTKINISIEKEEAFSRTTAFYKIKVITNKTKNLEKEFNGSRSKATNLKKGKKTCAFIIDDDEDWFVFKASKDGKYKIKSVILSDGGGGRFYVYKGRKALKSVHNASGDGYKELFNGKLKKGEKIYIKNKYIFCGSKNYKYIIKVK